MSGVLIDVRSDLNAVIVSLEGYRKELIDGAVVRALNRTATTVRAEAAREIHDVYQGLKIGDIKDQIRVERATRITMRTIISVSGRPIPIIKFSATQTRLGVTVKVKDQRKLIRHAFIAMMPGGHKGVFIRRGPPGSLVSRLPIDQIFSVSLPVAFSNKKIMNAVVRAARERFPGALAQEANFVKLKKAA
jgi:minor tail protein Z (GPZ)